MRKLLILSFIAASGLFISCSSGSGGMSATAKKNLEANKAITKAYEAGEFDKMKDYIAVDAIDHAGENGDVKGLDSIVSEMKRYRAMMPDMKGESIKDLADDDHVFSWAKVTGTMDGKKVTLSSVDVTRFKDGKAVEHWVFMPPADVMLMMPPMPAQSMTGPPVMDTAR